MQKSKIKKLIFRFIAFTTSTLAGTVVDFIVLWVFSHFIFKGWYAGEYVISNFISFECAVLANFACAYFFVWKDRISERSTRSFLRHYLGYNLSSTGGYLIQQVLICKIPALAISGGLNFIMNEWIVFRKKKSDDGSPGR